MKLFNSNISFNPIALFAEELCRNCSKPVEDEFLKGEINHPFFTYLDTIFGTRQYSSHSCLCIKCASVLDQAELLHIALDLDDCEMPVLNVYAACPYRGIVKKLIRKVKYDDDRLVADDLGRCLAGGVIKLVQRGVINRETIDNAILLPVPLHRTRKRKRGYNQAELIARQLESRFSCKIHIDILERKLNTKPQFDLDLKTRKINVVDAFGVRVNELDSRRTYIIVDDVFTTGATIKACAQVLLSANARNLFALSVACAV